MRISTRTMYEYATRQLNTLQTQMAKTQDQLANNKRVLTAADDPIAAARALEVKQSQSLNSQYAVNRNNANGSLALVEQALGQGGNLVMDVQTLLIKAGNAALSKSDRESIAVEIEGRMQDLLGVANSTDGSGNYLFSGYSGSTQPFVESVDGVSYQGDQGQRLLQVGASRTMSTSEPGNAVFMGARTGNGAYHTVAGSANQGQAQAGSGSVVNPAALNGHTYTLSFSLSAEGTTMYSVTDKDANPAQEIISSRPYASGEQVVVGGISFDINGTPAPGDSFEIVPSTKESVFKTIASLADALRNAGDDPAGRAALANKLTTAGEHLKSSLDNMLTVRASVGARMKELDYLDDAGMDLGIQYSATLSKLEDLDIAKAISDYTTQQMTLDAAQKSFKILSGLSLFNYIG